MQDIDFDEIDRAVNSITSTHTDARMNTAPLPISLPQVVSSPGVDAPVEPETLPPVTPSPAVRRSSGRFMDVVHPSSDMRPATNDRPSAPFAPSLQREAVAKREEVADRPEPTAVSGAAFHWPDPIDITPSEPTPVTAPEPVATIEPATVEPAAEVVEQLPIVAEHRDEDDFEDEDEEASPLESPFLIDTKVEKRPLGAFSGADADLPLLEDPIPFSTSAAPVAEVVPQAPVEVVELSHEEHEETPHELHPDLLALEGHGLDQKETEPLLEATNLPDPTPTIAVDDAPTGPTSITQQYTEKPASVSQPSGSIFDTESYHQPLTHAPKKHSGILIVVWIIALILVGGGIGAGVYFFVFPMLR